MEKSSVAEALARLDARLAAYERGEKPSEPARGVGSVATDASERRMTRETLRVSQ